MELISYSVVMKQVYGLMKKQKLSYQALSKLTKTPESTLKKWFKAEDGSFHRLNIVCDALGTSLQEVLKAIGEHQVQTFKMAPKQQDYFSNDATAFHVYWLLVYERYSAEEIQERLKLSAADLRKYFLKMDRLNLIDVDIKEKVLLPKIKPVRWSPEGPFMQKIFKSWSLDIITHGLQSQSPTDLILQYFQISAESEKELRKDLLALEEKYARRTIQEMRTQKSQVKKIRFLASIAEGEFLKK